MSDIAAIAAGLTKAQRQAILGDRFSATETWWELHAVGLCGKPGSNTGVGFTQLGLIVRTVLTFTQEVAER